MYLSRRQFFRLSASAAVLPAVPRLAWAQAYPMRPVRIVVPFAPAGGTDILARLMAQRLSERLGQQFIVDNRPGAGGNIGTEAVARATPDGYTLLATDASPTVTAAFYEKLNFNYVNDIAPIVCILRAPFLLVINPAVPAKTVSELLAYVKANPGKITMASAGTGSITHLTGALFMAMTGTEMVHVPYRGGGPAVTDLIGGQVQMLFLPPPAVIEHVRAGKLRALAVTSAARSEALPHIPSLAEFVPGFESSNSYGFGAPKSTPRGIIDLLNKEINVAIADSKLRERIAELGGTPTPNSPADFGKLIADDVEKWAKVVKLAGIKPE